MYGLLITIVIVAPTTYVILSLTKQLIAFGDRWIEKAYADRGLYNNPDIQAEIEEERRKDRDNILGTMDSFIEGINEVMYSGGK